MSATEEQKVEKEKSVPKDGQVMISILKDMGINEFEPRVVNQMLEFSYRWAGYSGFLISMNECITLSCRYVTNVLEDSKVYSQHSGKKNIDLDDVKLSVSMNTEQTFSSPPPRESLLELARIKNAVQLPIPTNKLGLRLPPDRHCLTNTNYKLKGPNKPSGFDYGLSNSNFSRGKGKSNNAQKSFNVVGSNNMINTNIVPQAQGEENPVYKIQVQAPAIKRKLDDMNE